LNRPSPILIDTSVWIDFFARHPGPAGIELRRLIEHAEPIVLTGIILTELLQWVLRDAAQVEMYLSQFGFLEPDGVGTYSRAAALFRLARSRGLTLTTVDVVIAALAIDYGARLFTLDRDFANLAKLAPLEVFQVS
jgi:predicted nucleic acid-binding protein